MTLAVLGLDGRNGHGVDDVGHGAAAAQIIDRLIQSLQDRAYGAIIAGPSVVPDYRYCWVRDGTFVAWAFDQSAATSPVPGIFRYAAISGFIATTPSGA